MNAAALPAAPEQAAEVVLGAEELTLLARLLDCPLPAGLQTVWSGDDALVADAVATRGLLARGLLRPAEPAPVVDAKLAALLTALRQAELVTEVEWTDEVGTRRVVLAGRPASALCFAQDRPDLWRLSAVCDVEGARERLLDDALPHAAGPTLADDAGPSVGGAGGTAGVRRAAFEAADGHAARGDGRAAGAALADAGVPGPVAEAVAGALATGRGGRLAGARLLGPGRYELDEVRWLPAGTGWWLVEVAEDEVVLSRADRRAVRTRLERDGDGG